MHGTLSMTFISFTSFGYLRGGGGGAGGVQVSKTISEWWTAIAVRDDERNGTVHVMHYALYAFAAIVFSVLM
jgi:hypothetical protein